MMHDALPEMTFPQRLRALRERSGKSRAVLAGLVGKSPDWVKSLETGRLQTPRLPMLLRLAEALGVTDLADLTGQHSIPVASVTKAGHPATESVAAALTAVTARWAGPADVGALTAAVDRAWTVWHRSSTERTEIGALLPDLIGQARTAVRGSDGPARRLALSEQARVYHLTQLFLANQPAAELVWLSADRAMAAAQDADDPGALAVAAWYYGHVYRESGQADAAEQTMAEVADLLNPGADVEQRARWGQLQLGIALAHSKAGRAGQAWRYHDRAADTARSLGPSYAHPWLMFGPAAVDAYRVMIEADLCRIGEAVRTAERLDYQALPSRTRRAAGLLHASRAYLARRDPLAAVHLIDRALRQSVDTVRHHPYARGAVLELAGRPGTVGSDARELALAIGVDT